MQESRIDRAGIEPTNEYIEIIGKALDDCDSDGISCHQCSLEDNCISWWDSVCSMTFRLGTPAESERKAKHLIQIHTQRFRKKKTRK